MRRTATDRDVSCSRPIHQSAQPYFSASREFRVYAGNDLAIDMVAYGSDYLLGLSTLAPNAFAERVAPFLK